jgi:hypothetical protein
MVKYHIPTLSRPSDNHDGVQLGNGRGTPPGLPLTIYKYSGVPIVVDSVAEAWELVAVLW